MSADRPISICELLKAYIDDNLVAALIPGGVFVGPADDAAQQAGCISIVEAGNTDRELYLPIIKARVQIRCVARTLDMVERMGRASYLLLNDVNREPVTQPSTGEQFLIHSMSVTAGPSNHFDSAETWESLLFISVMVGTQPIP